LGASGLFFVCLFVQKRRRRQAGGLESDQVGNDPDMIREKWGENEGNYAHFERLFLRPLSAVEFLDSIGLANSVT
jgi:hypothetical protein